MIEKDNLLNSIIDPLTRIKLQFALPYKLLNSGVKTYCDY